MIAAKSSELSSELASLLNKYSKENGSNTPDFILAEYLIHCLKAWDCAVQSREEWYGRKFAQGVLHSPKPTIEELEAILNDPNPPRVIVNPDGSCSAVG